MRDNVTREEARLSFFATAEGYYDYEKKAYIYQYKDHLGNTRVSYARINGKLEILDQNDYYPFGMNHLQMGSSRFGMGSWQNYKYNGKELQESGMYDYGARFYMPDIGRWGVIDPHQESYINHTPYNYVGSNPIIFIDPNGRDWYRTQDGEYIYNRELTQDNAEQFFRDNNIEGASYAFEYSTMGDYHYGANGIVYDDSKVGRGMPIEDARLHNIETVTLKGKASRNNSESLVSKIWNSNFLRYSLISDTYNIGLSSNVSVIFGIGTTPINITLLTRGKEPGLYFTPTINGGIGNGIEANAGVSFSRGDYTGNPRNITSDMLQGHTFGVSAGLGLGIDGSLGISYAPVNIDNPFKKGGFINVGGQIGIGIQGSPTSGINLQGNYQYAPIAKPIFKFK